MKANGIKPKALGQFESLSIDLFGRGWNTGEHFNGVVAVTAQVERLSIQEKYVALSRNLSNAKSLLDAVTFAVFTAQNQCCRVMVRVFGRPQTHIRRDCCHGS